MATPFTINGSLQIPPDAGMPVAPIPFSCTDQFDGKQIGELNLVGAGTHTVCFGTIIAPGAKTILVEVDPNVAAAPVYIQNNGGAAGQIEISPGGFMVICNPSPVAGTLSMQIVHSTNNKVRVYLLG